MCVCVCVHVVWCVCVCMHVVWCESVNTIISGVGIFCVHLGLLWWKVELPRLIAPLFHNQVAGTSLMKRFSCH